MAEVVIMGMLMVLASIFGLAALVFLLIWLFRDHISFALEVGVYGVHTAVRLAIQASVALVEWVDEQLYDLDIADEPLARGGVMGIVGLLIGVVLVMLLAMVRNQPWVIVTFAASVGGGLTLGFVADPDGDWSLPPFPEFPRRGSSGTGLPLNL
jgi:ElaB/YqjD/DUF883 family membrane-anchored ribosome-binding protein